MINNYIICFYNLSREEQIKQLLILLLFFLILFYISIFLDFIISKLTNDGFRDGAKNHHFVLQKILKKIFFMKR